MRQLTGIFLALALLLPISARAGMQGVQLDTSVTNLTTTFTLALKLTSPMVKNMAVGSTAGTQLAITFTNQDGCTTVPSSSTTTNPSQFFYDITQASGIQAIPNIGAGKCVWWRSASAASITSGILSANFW